jgi:NAD(P)-dependent dehydrogenase (short-subunit alcohol dehydrogenase family)
MTTTLITGANKGLGYETARRLIAEGHDVWVGARDEARGRAAADELGARYVALDVTDDASVASAAETVGALDVLVNNAGISAAAPAETEPIASFRDVLAVNCTSVFALSQLAGRVMLEQGRGSIVNLASIFGLVASAPVAQASYNASKAAVINLTRELAGQWARRGVRVNALAPGFFATEMTAELWADERSMKWIRRNTPLGRPGEAHELDGALLFLASDASSYVTGHALAVDGGWTSR